MIGFFKRFQIVLRTPNPPCEWDKCCDCHEKKETTCSACKYYYFIDSGYGYCRALPKPIMVAWCRFTCSLFKSKNQPT